MSRWEDVFKRVCESETPEIADIVMLLEAQGRQADVLLAHADTVRRRTMGNGILLRGIVEFSNQCFRGCSYCGLYTGRLSLERYHMHAEEILGAVRQIASEGVKTVVLQSGEDDRLDPRWLEDVVRSIKAEHDMAVTLSVGEKDEGVYALWRRAGADRYLLKIETSNPDLYRALHPDMSFERRLECLHVLRVLDYEVGCGHLVGLPGQTLQDLALDILFFQRHDFDMIGIGPFIAHPDTPLGSARGADIDMVLKVLALTRIVTKNAHIPATTAVGSLGEDHRSAALKAGANVLMPNFTPWPYRPLYEIYPNKRCVNEPANGCVSCMEKQAAFIGRVVDFSRGSSFKCKV